MINSRQALWYLDYQKTQLQANNWYLRRAVAWYEREIEDLKDELAATKRELNCERQRYLRICNESN